MTPEEKVAWEPAHKRGRRRYQLRAALQGLGFGLALALFNISRYPNANPIGPLVVAGLWGVAVYFFAGHHWHARDEEYRWITERDGRA